MAPSSSLITPATLNRGFPTLKTVLRQRNPAASKKGVLESKVRKRERRALQIERTILGARIKERGCVPIQRNLRNMLPSLLKKEMRVKSTPAVRERAISLTNRKLLCF